MMMKNDKKIKIVFWGTPLFGARVLSEMIKSELIPELVVCQPDKLSGRGRKSVLSEVKKVALESNIAFFQPEKLKNSEVFEFLEKTKADVFLVAAYGKIIPKEILEIPRFGCLNIHPSLLPRWRGASPIRSAILAGDKKTGISLMLMDEQMDHGPILSVEEFFLGEKNFTGDELEKILAEKGARLFISSVLKWINGEIKPQIQEEKNATYCGLLKKEDGLLNWNDSAENLSRKILAFNSRPGTFFVFSGKTFKVWKAHSEKNPNNFSIGKFFETEKKIAVACSDGVLVFDEIQPENKKIMNSLSFWCGYAKLFLK